MCKFLIQKFHLPSEGKIDQNQEIEGNNLCIHKILLGKNIFLYFIFSVILKINYV